MRPGRPLLDSQFSQTHAFQIVGGSGFEISVIETNVLQNKKLEQIKKYQSVAHE